MADENVNEDQTTPAESSAQPPAGDETLAEATAPTAEDAAGTEPTAEEPAEDAAAPEPVAEAAEGDTAAEPVAETPAEPAAEPAPAEPVAEASAEEPAAEEPSSDTPAAEAAAAGAPTPAQQETRERKKKKRLPRSQRPQRTKARREKPAERKPIVRLEKPEHERGRRQERQGTVVSDAMDKTIVVKVDTVKAHPRYKKVVRRSTKFHAHDEQNQAKAGDVVRIVETRPLSKTKRWRLAEVVEAAK